MSSGPPGVLALVVGWLAAAGCLFMALRHLRRKHLIDDVPTSKAQGVFLGLTELKGTAESEAPLRSFLGDVACVQHAWEVREQYTKTVTHTSTDSRGRTVTTTHRETHWKTVASGAESAPFYLKDDTGMVRIVPDRAAIEALVTLDETCSRGDALYFGKGPAEEVSDSDHLRHFYETAIPLHTVLYVMGQARERQDVVAPEIAYDKQAPMYLISTRTEKQVSSAEHRWFWLWAVLGLASVLGGTLGRQLLASAASVGSWQAYALALVVFGIVLLMGWVWTVYNCLVDLRGRVRQAGSQIDVQLQWRRDLIPDLAQLVEGYRSHERRVQELAAELRGQVAAARSGAVAKGLATAVRAFGEHYPELKANELFLKLQQRLTEAEQRIALARDYFNQIATFYNIRLLIIPDRFVAALARLRVEPLVTASDFERAPIAVRLVD